jgi:hypothetical protein
VSASLRMMWTARAATSAGPTTLPDGKRFAQLVPAGIELIAQERGREGRVDESGSDEVDPYRRQLERQVGDQGGQSGGEGGGNGHAEIGAPAAGAADEQQRASGSDLVTAVERYPECHCEALVEGAAGGTEVHVCQRHVGRTARCDHHVVERAGQILEELLEAVGVGGIERCCAKRLDLAQRAPGESPTLGLLPIPQAAAAQGLIVCC